MRKASFFRFVVLQVLVIPALCFACAKEIANSAEFDPEGPFHPTDQAALLARLENYIQIAREWQLGMRWYIEDDSPTKLRLLRVHQLTPTGLSQELVEVCNKAGEVAQRTTDAQSAFLDELGRMREMQSTRTGDAMDDFTGGPGMDRLMLDEAYLERFIQALIAVREIQRFVLAIEIQGANVVSGSRRLIGLSHEEIGLMHARIEGTSTLDQDVPILLLNPAMARGEASSLLARIAHNSPEHGGTHVGFRRILQRYSSLTRRLAIEDMPRFNDYLRIIDAARETATGRVPKLKYPFAEPTPPQ